MESIFLEEMNDPFADFDEEKTSQPIEKRENKPAPSGDNRRENEVFSQKIVAAQRTFFIDVKESPRGRFLKISEKSRGKRSTVMMDAEDVAPFVEAIAKAKEYFEGL